MAKAPGRLLYVLCFVVMTLTWGTTWAVIRVGLSNAGPLAGVALRFAIAAVVLAAVTRLFGEPLYDRRAPWWLYAAHAVLSFAVSYSVTYWAEQTIPSGLASVLFATFPLWVVGLGHFCLPGERLRPLAVAGAVLGFAGVAIIFVQDFSALGGPGAPRAAAVMLLSPFASAVGTVVVKRWGTQVSVFALNTVAMAMTAVLVGAAALAFERQRALAFDGRGVLALLYLALFGTALSFMVYFWLLQHTRSGQLALVSYAIPVVATITGVLAFGEPITARTVAGGLLVIAGVATAARTPSP